MNRSPITITHLYPRDMSIYGDLGNVIALRERLIWRGYDAKVEAVEVGQPYDFRRSDIIFGGGGQDSGQLIVGPDLLARASEIQVALTNGVPMLLICGLYQLFGRSFTTLDGRKIAGLGFFHAETAASTMRMIGNITIESARFGRLVGFENHSGQTRLDPSQDPLGKIVRGYGNNETSRFEGAVTANAVGTYLHGPVLPKNPRLADALLLSALKNRYGVEKLDQLDDELEHSAAGVASKRPQ